MVPYIAITCSIDTTIHPYSYSINFKYRAITTVLVCYIHINKTISWNRI